MDVILEAEKNTAPTDPNINAAEKLRYKAPKKSY